MAEFSILSDVSMTVVRMLREQLCPDPVPSPESIQPASPADKNADYHLGVFLYDIREIGEYRRSERVRGAQGQITYPARPLSLHYMLYLNSKAQIASGAEAEQRILGRAMQAILDHAVLPVSKFHLFSGDAEVEPVLSLQNLSFEEKGRIWSALSVPYQISIFFTAAPVLLSSRHEEQVTRVTQVEIGTHNGVRREGGGL